MPHRPASSVVSEMAADGGVRAISGFLFQVLVGGALRAAGECSGYRRRDEPELDALIEVARVGEVLHEFADEDLALRRIIVDKVGAAGSEITLVQVKFSVAGTARTIFPNEISTIISAFAKAKKRIEETGQAIGGYVLVTNRSLSGSKPTPSGAIERAILEQLRTVSDAGIADWHDALTHFARQFGRTDQEIANGRQALLGRIFETTVTGAAKGVITREDLLECLAGGSAARELLPTRLAAELQQQVRGFDADVIGSPVQRELMFGIETACAGRALVVFAGAGGSGKTAALHCWTREIAARATNSNADPSPLVAVRAAHTLPEDWLCDIVHGWNPALRPASPTEALDRLTIANRGAVPVLHLGLDGTDEYSADATAYGRVQRITQWFWQEDQNSRRGAPLRARLVVTCRDVESFARDWLSLARSGGSLSAAKAPIAFIFERFSETELRELLRANFPELESHVLRQNREFDASLDEVASDRFDTAAGPHPIAELLRDPVMWRSFCLVTDNDRARILAGENSAELRLVEIYCDRFLVKARSRIGLEVDDLRLALVVIAKRSRHMGRNFRARQEWQDAAIFACGFSIPQTHKLFREAESGGLIRIEQVVQWDWRNDHIESFLLSLAESSSL